jgi:hypothetical protein
VVGGERREPDATGKVRLESGGFAGRRVHPFPRPPDSVPDFGERESMTERAAALKCPKCGRREVDTLASTDSVFRYQRKTLACFHEWIICLERTQADLMAERNHTAETREANVTEKLLCPKGCGKDDFGSTRSRGAHARYCNGTPGAVPTPKREKKPKALFVRSKDRDVKWVETNTGLKVGLLASLADKRIERIAALTAGDPELAEIDRLVDAIEGAK